MHAHRKKDDSTDAMSSIFKGGAKSDGGAVTERSHTARPEAPAGAATRNTRVSFAEIFAARPD